MKNGQQKGFINHSGQAYVDFYIPEYNTFIEYNGILHYEYVPYFHLGGLIDFEKQLQKDSYIEQYCKEKNIKLLLISYLDNIFNVLEIWKLDR